MKVRYQILTFLYGSVVFWLMTSPRPLPETPGFLDFPLVGHFLVFGGMAAVVAVGIGQSKDEVHPFVLFSVPAVASSLYGASLEVVQLFVPMRLFEWQDMAANAIGAFTTQIVLCRYVWGIPMRHCLRPRRHSPVAGERTGNAKSTKKEPVDR